MEIFFYSENKTAPFEGPYKEVSSQNALLISNHEQVKTNFENYKDRIINEAIGNTITYEIVFAPVTIKDVFLAWLQKKYQNIEWHPKEIVSKPDIQIIGGDELNNFIKGMNVEEEWESVIKRPQEESHSKETNTKAVLQFEDEEQQNRENNEDKSNNTQKKEKKTEKQLDDLNIIIVGVIIIFIVIGIVIFKNKQENDKEKEIQKNRLKAEKYLVEGQFDLARDFAGKVNNSYYAKTMEVAIKEIERATPKAEAPRIIAIPPEAKRPSSPDNQLLSFLQQEANNAFKAERWTTPQHNSVVWWTKKILKIDPTNAYAKNILKRVIQKYLDNYKDKQQQLGQKLNTLVLQQTQLKDYANNQQRLEMTQLLGEEYWSQ